MVPPPINFDNPDLEQWKRLSQHLEEKAASVVDDNVGHKRLNGSLTEEIIPLKDSNDNKVIETYVCKENILDVDANDDSALPKTSSVATQQLDKVFDVLKSETEFDQIISLVGNAKEKVESLPEQIESAVDKLVTEKLEESPESAVLAKLNETLDNYDTTPEIIAENIQSYIEEPEKPVAEEPKSALNESVADIVSNTQQIIKNSFQQFIKDMTKTPDETDSEPKVEDVIKAEETQPETKPEEPAIAAEVIEAQSESSQPEEKKTDSMIFEEDIVQTAFNEELAKNPSQNQIIAIELFKQDVNEEQLANVTTLNEPEPTLRNMWGVEEKSYKTSVDQFVVKPVEVESVAQPIEPPEVVEAVPIVQEIIIESRKNSQDLLETSFVVDEGQQLVVTEEVIPPPSPMIQIEEQNGHILDAEEAATRIQAAFRGFQIRRSMSREASPNRSISPNHHIDNNNNSFNEGVIERSVEPQQQTLSLSGAEELALVPEQTLGNQLATSEASHISASNEQINSSLEKLEDQLIHELISSAEDDSRNQALLDDKLDTTQRLLDEMNVSSGELTAPLLLQRLQQTFDDVPHPEEQSQEVVPQTNDENVAEEAVVEDRPMIEKSDTIIVDLLSSNTCPQNSKTVISFEETLVPQDNQRIDDVVQEITQNTVDVKEEVVQDILDIVQAEAQLEQNLEEQVIESLNIVSEDANELSQKVDERPEEVVIESTVQEVSNEPEEINVAQTEVIESLESQQEVVVGECQQIVLDDKVDNSSATTTEERVETVEPQSAANEDTPQVSHEIESVITSQVNDITETTQQIVTELIEEPKVDFQLTETQTIETPEEVPQELIERPQTEAIVEAELECVPQVEAIEESKPESEPEPVIETSDSAQPKPETITEPETESVQQVVEEQVVSEEPPKPKTVEQELEDRLSPEPQNVVTDRHRSVTFSDPENEVIVYSKENSVEYEERPESEPLPEEHVFQTVVEPPTPDVDSVRQITPELSFVNTSEEAVLTKISGSSESEQDSDRNKDSTPEIEPSRTNGEEKRPKPILKETETNNLNINTDEVIKRRKFCRKPKTVFDKEYLI